MTAVNREELLPARRAVGSVDKVLLLLEMIRFSHTLFALPFALLAAAMAWMAPAEAAIQFQWRWLAGVMIAMVGARSAAMAFNRLVDRRIDAVNPRTASRHLPAGTLSVPTVITFTILSSLLFVVGTLMFWPNWIPAAIALPLLAVLLGYSYAKRFTALAHVWLGFALGLAPVCTWLGIRGEEFLRNPLDVLPAVMLGGGVMAWVSGFDIIYACQDAEFDRQLGLRSIPAWLGVASALKVAAWMHAAAVVCFSVVGFVGMASGLTLGLGWIWQMAVVAIGLLLIWEHRIVRPDDLSRVNVAFFNINVVISVGMLAVGLVDLIF